MDSLSVVYIGTRLIIDMDTTHSTGWRSLIGSLIFKGHCPQR